MSNTIFPGISGIPTPPTSPTSSGGTVPNEGSFGETLRNTLGSVERLRSTSEIQMSELLQGDRQDIHNVMIAVEKADVAFQLMMQVRNKILNAYQDVSKLQF